MKEAKGQKKTRKVEKSCFYFHHSKKKYKPNQSFGFILVFEYRARNRVIHHRPKYPPTKIHNLPTNINISKNHPKMKVN